MRWWVEEKWLTFRYYLRRVRCWWRGHDPRELPGWGFTHQVSMDWPSGENVEQQSVSERYNVVVCGSCGHTLRGSVTVKRKVT